MTEQGKILEFDYQRTIAAVIATNAVIANEQYRNLVKAIGRTVQMKREDHQYVSDEDADYLTAATETFTLVDFNFVVDPDTDKRYLAFLRTSDDLTNFPHWSSVNAFGDILEITIEKLTDVDTGETIWSFDSPGEQVKIDALGSDGIVQKINGFSVSYLGMSEQEKLLPGERIIVEEESLDPDYDRQLSVSITLEFVDEYFAVIRHGSVCYDFNYKIEGSKAYVLGKYSSDTIPSNDDNERNEICSKWGRRALTRVKSHILALYPEISEIAITPEELKIGGVYGSEYVAWSKEDMTAAL